jgi:hypothetical protein
METIMSIHYKAGYKYQLQQDYVHQFLTPFPLPQGALICTEYSEFLASYAVLRLRIRKGYAWDGPSGPTIDTKNFMRGSLVHDTLYELIRLEFLDKNLYRILADRELYAICRQDGMSWVRANVVYYGLRIGGNPAARKSGSNPLLIAP